MDAITGSISGRRERMSEIMDVLNENRKLKKKLDELTDELKTIRADAVKQNIDILDYSKGYRKGRDEAWECARRITCLPQDGGISNSGLDAIFEISDIQEIMKNFSASEALEKIREYEENKNKIQVGDEVESFLGEKYIVYKLSDDRKTAYGLDLTDYPVKQNVFTVSKAKKTGRHFDEIEVLLEKMRKKE